MEAKMTARTLAMSAWIFAAVATHATAQAPQGGQLEWRSDDLNLTFAYPADLVRRDPVEAIKDGHLMVYGVPGSQVPAIAEVTHCLKPLLSLELPSSGADATKIQTINLDGSATVTMKQALLGVILLAEWDTGCMSPEQQAKVRDPLTSLVEVTAKVPGMRAMMQPTLYTVANQKMHVAAAQGLPNVQEDTNGASDPILSYTMAFSANWNGHLLVWYFSSNSSATLNRITKSTVKFGKARAEVLYPVQIVYRNK